MSSESATKLQKILESEFEVKPFKILEENWSIVSFFFRISHLWKFGAMGGVISLDWTNIYAKANLLERVQQLELTPELIEGIEIIEHSALKELNRELNRKK